MADRLNLQTEFETILGSRNVYFQPLASLYMQYPCIRYTRSGYGLKHANDKVYYNTRRYEGVVIDTDPDSDIPDKILSHFTKCSFGNSYIADNLNHFPFTIYY